MTDPSKAVTQGTQQAEEGAVASGVYGNGTQAAREYLEQVAKTHSDRGRLYVPSKCQALLEKVEGKKKEGLEKAKTVGSVPEANGRSCTYNGIANCVLKAGQNGKPAKYECTAKDATATPPPGNAAQCQRNALANIARALVPGGTTPGAAIATYNACGNITTPPPRNTTPTQTPSTQSPFGGQNPLGGQSPSNSGNNNRCPSGFHSTNSGSNSNNRQVTCVKDDNQETKAQCLIVASKEKIAAGESVTIRWRTANAEDVDIKNIGNNVSKNSQKTVKPTKTTTYEIRVAGKGSNNVQTCDVTVTVDSTTTNTTGTPPKLSCRPTTIKKGKTGVVKWACPSSADTSTGTGIATKGKLSGEISVRPEHNTEYGVSCSKGTEEIGKDTCSIAVGEPTYDIIVHPTTAKQGDRVRISWASLFMSSCRVQGPRGFDFTREQGVVITEPFALDTERVPNRNIRAAIYSIECESQFGGTFSRDVTVRFGG